ncbi:MULTISPECIES: hypothetical protein [unclassified Butyrivibrio]|uniref:hypothetical protein n=1 Tax=unclassified Butyrivibrio TaxID=2639466 RepID=UPI0004157F0C|nr:MULTISPECIES: hypothetical protein [unclassified Butyrivibrio]SDB69764.1 hypothetical protein SAMN02910263_04516 [Butyrivibrio sp. INlla16]SEL80882.1 hypothetical protein SAMN04487770_1183 [Butyrivibrio sp. ob235]
MNINPMAIMELQQKFNTFKAEHPRVFPFFNAVKDSSLQEGTIFDMKITTPDGASKQCNIKLTQNDIDLFRTMMDMGRQQ